MEEDFGGRVLARLGLSPCARSGERGRTGATLTCLELWKSRENIFRRRNERIWQQRYTLGVSMIESFSAILYGGQVRLEIEWVCFIELQ